MNDRVGVASAALPHVGAGHALLPWWHNGAVRITKLEWRGIRVPLRLAPAERGPVPDRQALLVWIHTDDGLVGVGEASPVGPGRPDHTSDVARVLHDLAPSALGLPPSIAIGVLLALAPRTAAGDAARFGLETAALDLVGKKSGRPIVTLLGGVIDWVGMHANIGFEEPAEAARQAAEAVDRGFRSVKVTLGSHDPEMDVEVVRQVRAAIGPRAGLRADADEVWSPERAIDVLQQLGPYDLDFVEQPVFAEDLAGMAQVRRAAPMPIAADESVAALEDARKVIDAEAADVIVVKPSRVGGLHAARAIMELARDHGLGSLVSSSLETGVGIAASLHVAASLGPASVSGLASGAALEHDMLTQPLVPVRGHITVPQMPGLGVEVDLDAVNHYTTDLAGVVMA